jgi:hypothetical protein
VKLECTGQEMDASEKTAALHDVDEKNIVIAN